MNKLFAQCILVFAAIGLSACGGGSSSSGEPIAEQPNSDEVSNDFTEDLLSGDELPFFSNSQAGGLRWECLSTSVFFTGSNDMVVTFATSTDGPEQKSILVASRFSTTLDTDITFPQEFGVAETYDWQWDGENITLTDEITGGTQLVFRSVTQSSATKFTAVVENAFSESANVDCFQWNSDGFVNESEAGAISLIFKIEVPGDSDVFEYAWVCDDLNGVAGYVFSFFPLNQAFYAEIDSAGGFTAVNGTFVVSDNSSPIITVFTRSVGERYEISNIVFNEAETFFSADLQLPNSSSISDPFSTNCTLKVF